MLLRTVGILLALVVMMPLPGLAAEAGLSRCIPFYASILKTSLSRQVQVYIYPTPDAFAKGIAELGGVSPAVATRFARSYTYVPINYSIFILQPRMVVQSASESAYGLCLSIGLVFQQQFATPRRVSAHQWLRQGHGWMLAGQAQDSFKMITLAASRERALVGIREMRERTQGLPRLAAMNTVDGFQDAFERYGGANISYFLRTAAEFLLTKSSHDAFVKYFKGMAIIGSSNPIPDDVFESAFGMTVDQFQTQFDDYLADLLK